MKKKISLFNGIFFNEIRRFWGLGCLYLILIFLNLPFKIIGMINKLNTIRYDADYIYMVGLLFNQVLNGIMLVVVFIISCTIGFLVMKEIYDAKSSIHIHSLPITKIDILINKMLAGIVLIVIPIAINFIITELIVINSEISKYITQKQVLNVFIMMLIFSITFLMQGVLISTLFSNILLNGILLFFINILPVYFIQLKDIYLDVIFYGRFNISRTYNIEAYKKYFFPFISLSQNYITPENITVKDYIIFLMIIIALVALSILTYIKRKNENANKMIVFNSINYVFKYTITLIATLIGGSIVGEVSDWGLSGVFLGGAIGAFLGYYISEAVIRRDINVFRYLRGYFVYVGLMIVFLLLCRTDLFFKHNPPKLEEIDSVYILSNSSMFNLYEINEEKYKITNEEIIKDVLNLHEYLSSKKTNMYTGEIYIKYNLKNGGQIKRIYKVRNYDKTLNKYMNNIAKDQNYIKANTVIFNINEDDIIDIGMYSNDKFIKFNKKDEIKYIIDKLKQEVLTNKDFKEVYNQKEFTINIAYKDRQVYGARQTSYVTYPLDIKKEWIKELINKN